MTAIHEANYRPTRRKPAKDWAPQGEEKARVEAMLAKCKKHTENRNQADAAPSDAGVLAPTPRGSLPNSLGDSPQPQLVWNRTGSHEMTSGCQRYKVTKETIGHLMTEKGKATCTHAWRYQCWVRVEWLWFIHLGPLQLSFDAAQAVCETDASKSSLSALSQRVTP
jgi:hypothetical protein